jgi:hypothetical protein
MSFFVGLGGAGVVTPRPGFNVPRPGRGILSFLYLAQREQYNTREAISLLEVRQIASIPQNAREIRMAALVSMSSTNGGNCTD